MDIDRSSDNPGSTFPFANPNGSPIATGHNLEAASGDPKNTIINNPSNCVVVKWFDPKRGFGFVVPSDGSGEAFLHQSILTKSGIETVGLGAVLQVRIVGDDGRPRVAEVLSVDSSTAAPTMQHHRKTRSSRLPVEAVGTIKWFNADKGYGFVAREKGGQDVFVHASALRERRVSGLLERQRVIMDVVEGRRGPKAINVRLIFAVPGLMSQSDEGHL